MHVHMWCHAVLHVKNPISSCANINLHVTRRGHLTTHGIVYMMRDLAVETYYTMHKNDIADTTSSNIVLLVSA